MQLLLKDDSTIFRYILICSFFLLIYILVPVDCFCTMITLTSSSLWVVLNAIGMKAVVFGSVITMPKLSVEIVPECTPILSYVIYSAFIISRKSDLRKKIHCLLIGFPLFFASNVLRLTGILIISSFRPDLFSMAHIYFGQIISFGFLVAMCIWASQVRDPFSKNGSPVVFLVKVALLFSLMLPPWMYLFGGYVNMIGEAATFFLGLLGHRTGMALKPGEIPYASFTVVSFMALIISTQSIKTSTKIVLLLLGICSLTTVHVFMCITLLANNIQPQPVWSYAFKICSIAHGFLPVLIWVLAVHWDVLSWNRMKETVFFWNSNSGNRT